MRTRRTRTAAVLAGVLLLTACSGADEGTGTGSSEGSSSVAGAVGGSALDDLRDPAFPEPLLPLDDLLSGGPPPDGIPAIDEPRHQPVEDVDWLDDDEPVLSLTVGEETTFGVSGLLYADNLVMFDRATESLWPQLTGRAAVGVRTGTELRSIPMGTVGWAQFREEHPDALVLSRETGHDRDYGRNPYVGYDDPGSDPLFPLPEELDGRLPAKARVVGVGTGTDAVAVERDRLAAAGAAAVDVGGRPVTLWHLPGQRSALGAAEIAEGAEIGTVAAFVARLDGEELRFGRDAEGSIIDEATGSTWNAFGRATDGPLAGQRLRPVVHLDTFWFSWVAFQPDTDLASP